SIELVRKEAKEDIKELEKEHKIEIKALEKEVSIAKETNNTIALEKAKLIIVDKLSTSNGKCNSYQLFY
ncbi:MAG: hypothetical protein RSC84_07375, partial [Peptostreptococcaceae bacterium]